MFLRVWDVTFTVSDLERAADFYGRVLEFPAKYAFSSYIGLDCGGVEIGLVPGDAPEGAEGASLVDFLVPDVDEAYRRLTALGVRFLKAPHDTPWEGASPSLPIQMATGCN
jgi:catechol 2,3-dioxygenase-like lactoylglutathione lyase family enzyme